MSDGPTLDGAKNPPQRKIWRIAFIHFPLALTLFSCYAIGFIGGIVVEGIKIGATLGTDWVDRMMKEWEDYKL